MPRPSPIPEGFHTLTTYLIVPDAERQIAFLRSAFDAEEEFRSTDEAGRVMHAQLRVGDSRVMLGESNEQWPPTTGSVYMYVDDCDTTYRKALEAGGESVMELADQFYGDRHGGVKDPSGNVWWISTHVEDVSQEEMERRMKERRPAS